MASEVNTKRVKLLRRERGWTQEHLAQVMNVSVSTIQRVESTGKCGLETRNALAAVFSISVVELDDTQGRNRHPINDECDDFPLAPEIPLSPASFFAYANGHPRAIELVHAVAKRRHLQVRPIDSESAYLHEQLNAVGVKTIRALDSLIAKHGDVASRLLDYMQPEGGLSVGLLISLVLDVTVIEGRGRDDFVAYRDALRFSSGNRWYAEMLHDHYMEIKSFGQCDKP